jgi:predicted amidophosphoribosyltransferase
MADRYGGAVRQLPCPDCGSPVRPDTDQLCPNCGYPLMFLRQPAEDEARAVPRSPNEREDNTGMVVPRQRLADNRQFATGQARQAQCPACGYPNEAVRIRCERCGHELRVARPQAVVLGPPPVDASGDRWAIWLIVLVVLAVLSVLSAVVTLLWSTLTATG